MNDITVRVEYYHISTPNSTKYSGRINVPLNSVAEETKSEEMIDFENHFKQYFSEDCTFGDNEKTEYFISVLNNIFEPYSLYQEDYEKLNPNSDFFYDNVYCTKKDFNPFREFLIKNGFKITTINKDLEDEFTEYEKRMSEEEYEEFIKLIS
jgi:hypothetical protein